jgi:hypothetical protein
MFMLAATTAGVVLFRYVGQENFASGARLKSSEAYQASQAGLEAVQGWLENKGADAGTLIKQFDEQTATKLRLTEQLGGITEGKQKFEVYLVGIDTKNQPYKLKFLSIGEARNGSRYSQIGIFDVEGLYKITMSIAVPGSRARLPSLFVGGGANKVDYGGTNTVSSAYINGNWEGNPPKTLEDFVVTGNFKLSGSHVDIGGSTCIGKNFNMNNNATSLNDVYVEGNLYGAGGTFENLYVKGSITKSYSNEFNIGEVAISKNLTVFNGVLETDMSGHNFVVSGNLVMPNGQLKLESENRAFIVKKDVCIPRNDGITGSNCSNNKHTLGQSTGSLLVVNNVTQSGKNYKNNASNVTFTSNGTLHKISNCIVNGIDIEGAEVAREYCNTIWQAGQGCNGESYIIPDIIKTAPINEMELKKANNLCSLADPFIYSGATGSGSDNHIKTLNDCYAKAKTNNGLYNDEYVVIKMKYPETKNVNDNATPKALVGKFIFIFDEQTVGNFKLPPTASNGYVMMYLKNGVDALGMIEKSLCEQPYNYFIYILKNNPQINGFSSSCPIKGNVYMPQKDPTTGSNNCSSASELKAQGNSQIIENESFLEDLFKQGIICDYGSGSCSPDGGEIQNPEDNKINDSYYVPTTSHLKVNLQSKYANEESYAGLTIEANHAVLVMPRVIYLEKNNTVLPAALVDYFNVLYLNGAYQDVAKPLKTASVLGNKVSCSPSNLSQSGLYTCNLNLEDATHCKGTLCKNPFYVVVGGEARENTYNLEGTLTCTGLPQSGTVSKPVTNTATVLCDGRPVSSGITWTPSSPPWTWGTAGKYDVSVTADCQGSKTRNCGSIDITQAGTLTCTGLPQSSTGKPITKPTVQCDGTTITSGITWVPAANNSWWDSPPPGTQIVSASATCGGTSKNVTCGTIEVKESGGIPTLTCEDVTKTVTLGEQIPVPAIFCSDGETVTDAVFKSTSSKLYSTNASFLVIYWNMGIPTYFSEQPSSSAKTADITVTSVKCGDKTPSNLPKKCGTYKVNKPTCSGLPINLSSGLTINPAPTVSCGSKDNVPITPTLNTESFTSSNCNWTGSGTSGYFTSTGTCTLTLNRLACDGNNLTNVSVPCYTGSSGTNPSIEVGTSSIFTCSVKQYATLGEDIGLTLNCPSGKTVTDRGTVTRSALYQGKDDFSKGGDIVTDEWAGSGIVYFKRRSATETIVDIYTNDVQCGSDPKLGQIPCGKVIVGIPSCSFPPVVVINATVTPTIDCGNSIPGVITSNSFKSNCNNNWNGTNTGGSFTAVGTNCILSLQQNQFSCYGRNNINPANNSGGTTLNCKNTSNGDGVNVVSGGTITASCSWPEAGQVMYSGQDKPVNPTITCSPGNPNSPNWSGLPSSPMVKGTYTLVPSDLTCDGIPVTTLSTPCPTLTVKQAPIINTCTGTASQTASPTQPTISLSDPDNICSSSNSNAPNTNWKSVNWTVSKNGTNVSNSTWGSIFNDPGIYSNYSVSGKCGDYPNNLTSTCTGNATLGVTCSVADANSDKTTFYRDSYNCVTVNKPKVKCGTATIENNISFDIDGSQTNAGTQVWDNNATTQILCPQNVPVTRAVYLNSVTCNNATSSIRVHCGDITIENPSGNNITITEQEQSFPVGTYSVNFSLGNNYLNFKCKLSSILTSGITIGTYTESSGSVHNITISAYNEYSTAIRLGDAYANGTGTFNITVADVKCRIMN